jgi:DNA-directed RNA polymerase specialized sigma subunit
MPKIILTIDQVKEVKQLLLEGELAHHEIAARVGISRPQVSKIHLGMKDPYDKNGRWQKVIV